MAERASKIRKPSGCEEGTKQSRGRSVTKMAIMGKRSAMLSRHEVTKGVKKVPRGQEGTKKQRALCSQGAPGDRERTKWLGRRHLSRGRQDQEPAKY